MYAEDFNTMKCLTHLHHAQENICIDVEGSQCADEIGGWENTKIGNGQKGFNWFSDTADPLSQTAAYKIDRMLSNLGAVSEEADFRFYLFGTMEARALDDNNKVIGTMWYRGTGADNC